MDNSTHLQPAATSGTSNAISEAQNLPQNLRLLAAQRGLYTRAKLIVALQLALTVAVPLSLVVAASIKPDFKVWAALLGFMIAAADAVALDPLQKSLKLKAARMQELFDCAVLGLPWDAFRVGTKPDHEDIVAYGSAHAADEGLKNWYPRNVGDLPLHLARLICQRSNCWWDMKLRRRYKFAILTIVCCLAIVVLAMAVQWKMTLADVILGAIAPLTPLVAWSLRESRRQQEAIEALERLKLYSHDLWRKAISREMEPAQCDEQARWLQSELFDRRRTNPLIFNWIYRLSQRRFEDQMQGGANEMILEANRQGS
jgi:SMODS-associating 4TM effector domain